MSNMKININILFKALILVAITGLGTIAFDVKLAGTIDNSLFAPSSITVSNDKITVLEPFSRQIKIFSTNGVIERQVNFTGEANSLTEVTNLLYLYCDREKRQITAIDFTQIEEYDFFFNSYTFKNPVDIVKSDDHLYILDAGTNKIVKFSLSGEFQGTIQLLDMKNEPPNFASSFTIDPATNNFYIFDQITSKVWIINSKSEFQKSFGSFGASEGQITRGGDILFSPAGAVFVADRYQNKIVVYDPNGNFMGNIDLIDGSRINFNIPSGLAIDENGLLYVVSTEGANIKAFYLTDFVTSTNSIMAIQVYPNPSDTIGVTDVKLVASTETTADTEPVLGFDFQLFFQETTESDDAVLEVSAVKPEVVFDTITTDLTFTSEWLINDTLDNDSYYEWRTRLRFKDSTGQWSAMRNFKTTTLPYEFRLDQNYPNPFNPTTTISFSIPDQQQVKLEVFNLLGQKIIDLNDKVLPAGNHFINWDGTNKSGASVATGIYFYRISTEEFVQSKKMVLIK